MVAVNLKMRDRHLLVLITGTFTKYNVHGVTFEEEILSLILGLAILFGFSNKNLVAVTETEFMEG